MNEQLAFDFSSPSVPSGTSERDAAEPDGPECVPTKSARPPKPDRRAGRQAKASRVLALTPLSDGQRPPTLHGCLAWLGDQLGPGDAEVKEVAGAVRTILKVTHKVTQIVDHDLPARPTELRPHLRDALPAAIKLSRSRFDNAKSLIKTLLIAVGWVSPHARNLEPLPPYWAERLAGTSRMQSAGALPPFFRFCARCDIAPEQITGKTLDLYEIWLSEETLDLRPRHTVNAVATSWRRMQRVRDDWPGQDLRVISRKIQKFSPVTELPASFGAELQAYLAALRAPDPLDPVQGRPLSEISVNHARRALLRAATYLARSGRPVEQITSLAVLVEPAAFRAIAQEMHADGLPLLKARRETAQWARFAYDIAASLVQVARRWVRLPAEAMGEIVAIHRRIKPRQGGLSERVQSSLAELLTDEERTELYGLPWRAFEVADAMLRDGDVGRAAKLHETALALAIVLVHPLRLRDLARLDLTQHMLRDRRGSVIQIAIRTHKTAASARSEVDPDLSARIGRHIGVFRKHIPGHDTTSALFPSEGGKSRWPGTLGRLLHRLVAQQLGKRFTAQLARHLAVDICLDDDPRNMAIAQRLLSHRTARTTESIYGARATLAASRRFNEVLREQAKRAGLPGPGERSPKRGRRRR